MQTVQLIELSPEIQADIAAAEAEVTHSFPSNRSTKFGAVLTADGQKFNGANIRRRAFSNSTCAERMAIDSALHVGVKHIERLVIFGHSQTQPFTSRESAPCGLCRQILADATHELDQPDFEIILCSQNKKDILVTSLTELFPLAYEKAESQVI